MSDPKDDVPKYYELMNPTLEILRRLGGSASIHEIAEELPSELHLSEDVAEVSHGSGGQTELEYRAGWARTYLKKFGLIDNSKRGVWALTSEGRDAGEVDPTEVVQYVREQSRRRRKERSEADEDAELDPEDTEDLSWQEQVIQAMEDMDPEAFERLCQRLLRESGFIEVEVTNRGSDGGIDGHGIIRLAGLISFTVLFQSKRWTTRNISASTVRDFRGAMVGRADKGLIITTGGFTRDARREATRDGTTPIDLIDGQLLADKLKELELGVTTRKVEEVDVDTEWFASI